MVRTLILSLPVLLAVALTGPARAATISLLPSDVNPPVGGTFSLDIMVDGLGASGAPSVGGFQIDLSFDGGLLAGQSVSFGSALGTGSQVFTSESIGAGSVTLNAVSLLAPATLDALQGASVLLGSVAFQRLDAAAGTIGFGSVLLSDSFGSAINVTAATGASMGTAVPEPTAALVFAVGTLVVASALRGRQRAV